ncbi:MAG: AraC family transcriptional regulator [Spirochaetota bacterium]
MTLAEIQRALPDAIIILADHFRFAAAEQRSSSCVSSRRLFWCRSGKGSVTVNNERFALSAGKFLCMPWDHAVVYEADRRSPFVVGSIHIIPNYPRRTQVIYNVSHEKGERDYPQRSDVALPGLTSTMSGDLALAPSLGMLSEYIVSAFRRDRGEMLMRALAPVIIHEVMASLSAQKSVPPSLAAAVSYLEKKGRVTLSELSRIAHCSSSTVIRMFREHYGTTPGHFIIERKIARAKDLLTGTGMPIESVAEAVGITDPFYFSRIFKKIVGVSPRQCRTESRFL